MDQIPFDSTPAPSDQMSFDTGTAPVTPSPAVAQTRAYKAHFGLSDVVQKDENQIYQDIANGKEDAFRREAATNLNYARVQEKNKALTDLAAQRGSALSLEEFNALLDPQAPANQDINPQNVIEQGYAHAYVATLPQAADRMQDTPLSDAQAQDPAAVERYMNVGSDLLTKREIALTKAQNLQPAVEGDSWFNLPTPWGSIPVGSKAAPYRSALNMASAGIGGSILDEFSLRGNVDNVSRFTGIGEGENLDAQARALLDLPLDQYTAKFNQITDTLQKIRPDLAQKFANSVAGMSTSDKIIDDANTAVNAIVAKGVYGVVKSGLKGAGENYLRNYEGGPRPSPKSPDGLSAPGTVDAVKNADGTYTVPNTEAVQKAVKDVVQSANTDEVTKSSIAAGAGDIKEAAVQSATSSTLKPDPLKDTIDPLTRNFRGDIDNLRNDPGSLTREEHTRLINARDTFMKEVVDTNVNTTKITRTPIAVEDGFRDIQPIIAQYYPGRANTIANVNMRYEPETNTWWADSQIVNYNAEQFSSLEAAANHAQRNGYLNPTIRETGTAGQFYIPEAAIKRPWEEGTRLGSVAVKNGTPTVHTDDGAEVQLATVPQVGHIPLTVDGTTFKTSKGSVYKVNSDKTTTRTKAARPEHPGDEGLQQKSDTTAYITPEQYKGIKANKPLEGSYQKEPKEGLIPVEWWQSGPNKGKIHFGNVITSVNHDGVSFGKTLTEETVKTAQQGLGYHLVVSKPINEIDNYFRNGLIADQRGWSTSNQKYNKARAWGNAVASAMSLRSPLDTLSTVDNRNRIIAAYSQSKFAALAVEQMKYIEDLAKGKIATDEYGEPTNWVLRKGDAYIGKATGRNNKIWTEFVRFLDAGRKLEDNEGLPGKFFNNSEMEDFYLRTFDRMPAFAERQAYRAFTDLYTYDLYMREVGLFKNKARLGAEQHELSYLPAGSNSGEKIKVQFDGVFRKVLPQTEDLMMLHQADGTYALKYANTLNDTAKKKLQEGIETGRVRVSEVYDPEARELKVPDSKGFPARVRYVVSNDMGTRPLSKVQIGRRGGGHFEWDFDHYLKYPIIKRQWVGNKIQYIYEGDATLCPVKSMAEGKEIGEGFNAIKNAIKAGDIKLAKALNKKFSDAPWKEVSSWFRPLKNPKTNEMVPARFDLEHDLDFQVVPNGTTIHELNKDLANKFKRVDKRTGTETDMFVDGTRHGSLARNYQVEYTGRRDSYDLYTFKKSGNKDNAVYKYEPAEFTDPIVTLTRGLNRIINTTFMDDMKISGMEHWLEENKGLLKAKDSEIRAAPFAFFNDISLGSFKKGDGASDIARKVNAMDNLYKIRKFTGLPSMTDTMIHGIKQTMADGLYGSKFTTTLNNAGDLVESKGFPLTGKVIRAPTVAPEWLLDRIHNPVTFLRGMAFHTVMGLWAIPQIFVQQANWTTIVALSPMHVMQGSFGTLMHWWSKINRNPEITAAMDFAAGKFGWRPGDLTEARRVLDHTGFETVGAEHALRSGYQNKKYVQPGIGSDVKKITMDWGQYPFMYGEQNVRIGAWYTAFHEFRTANPFSKIGQIEEGKILARANILYGDMSRAGNSIVNTGILAIPAQFWTYQYRLVETFYSKARLGDTVGERIRNRAKLLLVNAALYGVGGLAIMGLPFGDIARKTHLDHGYVAGKDALETFIYEGGLALLGQMISSDHKDRQTGTLYNFAKKYGPSGLPMLTELIYGDESIWKALGGAAKSKASDSLNTTSGLVNAFMSMVKGEVGREAYPMTLNDWIEGARFVNSFNSAYRLGYAIEYGKWINKHEQTGANVQLASALWMTLSGTDLTSMDDQYLKGYTNKERLANFKKARADFTELFTKAQDAIRSNDPTAADNFNKQAFATLRYAHIPEEHWGEIQAYANKSVGTDTIKQNDQTYYTKFLQTDEKASSRKAYEEQLQLQRKQGQ